MGAGEACAARCWTSFARWGFDYIEPPVIEYLDALLVGSGERPRSADAEGHRSGQRAQLGVRADMTSQAVRIDAHSLVTDAVQRLCYAGNVVFANPQLDRSSRVPLKAGAEIFGAADLSADAEVMQSHARRGGSGWVVETGAAARAHRYLSRAWRRR